MADSWNALDKAVQQFGRVGGERTYRLRPLAARTTLAVLEALESIDGGG